MNKISIMSYNIWFDDTDKENRLISLIDIIKQKNPDIICLQEVTPNVSKYLIVALRDRYNVYPSLVDTSYGCMIFSRYRIIHGGEYNYAKTIMGRKLHYIVIEYDAVIRHNLVIATSHFESEFKKINEIKIKQYNQAQHILNELYNIYGCVVFCADTNILPHEEMYYISKDTCWLDTWKENGCENSAKYTYDTKLNLNLKKRNFQKQIRSRIDRIIYRGYKLVPLNFKLIKYVEHTKYLNNTHTYEPSDHFGICADFELVDNTINI